MPLLSQLALEEEPQLPGPWLTRPPSEAVVPPLFLLPSPRGRAACPRPRLSSVALGTAGHTSRAALGKTAQHLAGLGSHCVPAKAWQHGIPGTSNSPPLPVLLPSSPLHKLPLSFKALVVQSRLQHMNLIHTMNRVSRSSPYILFSIS